MLALKRRATPQESVMVLDAARAPERDAMLAVTREARVRLDVTGAAGEGELVFDTFFRRLVSYRMTETAGLEATLVTQPEGEPVGERLHWTVTVRFEVERVD